MSVADFDMPALLIVARLVDYCTKEVRVSPSFALSLSLFLAFFACRLCS